MSGWARPSVVLHGVGLTIYDMLDQFIEPARLFGLASMESLDMGRARPPTQTGVLYVSARSVDELQQLGLVDDRGWPAMLSDVVDALSHEELRAACHSPTHRARGMIAAIRLLTCSGPRAVAGVQPSDPPL